MQYTLRNIPAELDAALRARARLENKTLNEVALEAMAEGLGIGGEPAPRRSLADVVGALTPDEGLDAALAEQRRIDPELWK